MFKGKGRHARRGGRLVGPLFAVEALTVMLSAKKEMEAASEAQSRRDADGAR